MLELSSNTQLPFQPKPRSEVPQAQQEQRLSHPKGYKCLQGEQGEPATHAKIGAMEGEEYHHSWEMPKHQELQLSNGKLLGKEIGNEQLLLKVCG